ncbi:MAG TPA: site-2 protease family protein [Thermoanaerobaculia bacterium]|nr:site-2 protease family protein [Thermoanaerobaculia bacterium]
MTYLLARTDVETDLLPFLLPSVVQRVWSDPALLRIGLSFSIPALLILLAHELGHYIACRRYRLAATLPYFLPVPFNFGTFGAFIKIKAPIRSKKELFDVGIAGPIAGFVALLPFLFYGIAHSVPAPLRLVPEETGPGLWNLGRCLAIQLAAWPFHGWLGSDVVLNLHPFALAAWLGLLATSINLLPLGQLDGGHILYAATGRLQRRLALPIWLLLGLAGFLWQGWFLWCLIVLVFGLFHPPVADESAPLGPWRRGLAWIALAMLVLSFIPLPLELVFIR